MRAATQLCSSIAALLLQRRSRRATAAAAGGRTSQNLAAIGALLYDATQTEVNRTKFLQFSLLEEFFIGQVPITNYNSREQLWAQ